MSKFTFEDYYDGNVTCKHCGGTVVCWRQDDGIWAIGCGTEGCAGYIDLLSNWFYDIEIGIAIYEAENVETGEKR